jgi:hypothetical protein
MLICLSHWNKYGQYAGTHMQEFRRSGMHIITYFVLHIVISIRPKLERFKKCRCLFFLLYFWIESLCLQRSTVLTYPTCSSRLPWRCLTAQQSFSYILMLHLLFPYRPNVFLLHQTILTQNTQCTIKHHTPAHKNFTIFPVKLYNSKHIQTNKTPVTTLTSGAFNRNDSAHYFVNMPEHGVCSLHGLLLSLLLIDKACCCVNTELYFDRCKGFEFFFRYRQNPFSKHNGRHEGLYVLYYQFFEW